ncbi:MAG: F0F1 ATP synthase subunit epsilon [Odoribacteraceae bacterium]|jgi:F-type H+-transporting ATPase subunit epsilon|nr:F0F1 ATP synthase subunit epsilon [Odoribacteraceae bacterium]
MVLKIISPERVLYQGEVESVTLPGALGLFMVLKDHAPLVSALAPGSVVYIAGGTEHAQVVERGMVEVRDNEVVVCTG